MSQKTIAIAIEGDVPQGARILAQGEGDSLGTRAKTKWAIIRIPVDDARALAATRAVYPAGQGIGGWHYTRRALQPKQIG